MRLYIKYVLYLIVFYGSISSHAGSYDDFFTAIKRDDAATVFQLLERGFDPNTVDPKGQFGLVLAVREPSPKVIDVLLQNPQTKVEVRTPADESPLMLAALKGQTELCQKLIARDADINKPGWTPLHYAASGGHLEVIQLLLDNHAYIDAASPNGSTPLMMAAMYGTTAAVQLLLDAGADVQLRNQLKLSALDFAVRGSKVDSIELLTTFIRAANPKGQW
jgi:ankyrin repeat protein